MGEVIKKSEVRKLFPRRDCDSHKGQNGRLLIIGGSEDYFGAPILAGLGALGSGADLAYLLVPECNFDVSRSFYPDFIVRKYPGHFINNRVLDVAGEILAHVDAVLSGPGIGKASENKTVIERLIQRSECPVVLDAEAIQAVQNADMKKAGKSVTITPHHGEFKELVGQNLPEDFNELKRLVEETANRLGVTILLKGPASIISGQERQTRVNITGNAGMTVGGSGDVLAGLVTSLIAQKLAPFDACACASFLLGATGDNLYRQKGYNFTATDLALELSYAIHSIVS